MNKAIYLGRLTLELVHSVCSIWAKSRMSTRNDDRGSYRPPRPSTEHQPTRQRATDQEIQKWISRQHGFVPESAWIAHCKELFGLAVSGTAVSDRFAI